MSSERVMCPSAPCEPGAVLLGVVVAEGQVAYARDRIVVDEEFVQIARAAIAGEAISVQCAVRSRSLPTMDRVTVRRDRCRDRSHRAA